MVYDQGRLDISGNIILESFLTEFPCRKRLFNTMLMPRDLVGIATIRIFPNDLVVWMFSMTWHRNPSYLISQENTTIVSFVLSYVLWVVRLTACVRKQVV